MDLRVVNVQVVDEDRTLYKNANTKYIKSYEKAKYKRKGMKNMCQELSWHIMKISNIWSTKSKIISALR